MESMVTAPWDDTMGDKERGHGDGEGIPPGSDDWTVFDWDNYDARGIIHSNIMVLYEIIAFTRIGFRTMRDHDLRDSVINLLSETIDKLDVIRENGIERRIF